jgi:predicted metal-binding membrane protein
MSTATAGPGLLQSALRRDRVVVAAGLAGVTALAWTYIIHTGRVMSPHAAMAMPMSGDAGAPQLGWLIPMWIVMMVAMMVPSAAPAILLFASVARRRRATKVATASAAVFTLGYLLVWAFYATIAAVSQWELHRLALLSPAMVSASPWLGGGLLVAAGFYQWLPLKDACLSRCRSPLGFLSEEWREGTRGALVMGVRHGTFCVGCCALLMALLFVAGVMNLLWVAVIAIFVLAEKLGPSRRGLGRVAGLLMIGWGIWVIAAGFEGRPRGELVEVARAWVFDQA